MKRLTIDSLHTTDRTGQDLFFNAEICCTIMQKGVVLQNRSVLVRNPAPVKSLDVTPPPLFPCLISSLFLGDSGQADFHMVRSAKTSFLDPPCLSGDGKNTKISPHKNGLSMAAKIVHVLPPKTNLLAPLLIALITLSFQTMLV